MNRLNAVVAGVIVLYAALMMWALVHERQSRPQTAEVVEWKVKLGYVDDPVSRVRCYGIKDGDALALSCIPTPIRYEE